jgi:PilZ domain-containing protein
MEPGQETVRWLKFSLDVRLGAIVVNRKPYEGSSRVGHLDETGIGIFIPANLKKGDVAVLEFTLPNSEVFMKVTAKLATRTGFRYWFEFTDLSPEQQQRIQRACAALQKSEAVQQPNT